MSPITGTVFVLVFVGSQAGIWEGESLSPVGSDHNPRLGSLSPRPPWHFTYTLLDLLWEAALVAVEVFAEPFSGDYDPATPRYQIASGLCDDGIHVRPVLSLAPANRRSWHRSHQDHRGSRIVL
jgi:hypothetical protein